MHDEERIEPGATNGQAKQSTGHVGVIIIVVAVLAFLGLLIAAQIALRK
jgi:hypothetical protein